MPEPITTDPAHDTGWERITPLVRGDQDYVRSFNRGLLRLIVQHRGGETQWKVTIEAGRPYLLKKKFDDLQEAQHTAERVAKQLISAILRDLLTSNLDSAPAKDAPEPKAPEPMKGTLTQEQLFKYADDYARERENEGKGTQYPTFKQVAKRFKVSYDHIEALCESYDGGGYMGAIVGFGSNGGYAAIEKKDDYQVEAYK